MKGGVADVASGGFIYRHHVMPREYLCAPNVSSSPVPLTKIDVVRQTKTNWDNLKECSIDVLWNIGGQNSL